MNNDEVIIEKDKNKIYNSAIKGIQKGLKNNHFPLDDIRLYKSPFEGFINKYNNSIIPIVTNKSFINQMGISNNTISILKKTIDYNSNIINSFINSFNIGDVVADYVNKYQGWINTILEAIEPITSSKLSGLDSSLLKKYYWVIPFEYKYEKIQNLSKYKSRIQFEKYIERYFTENRTKKLFSKLKKQFKENDKKELIKQIEYSYQNGNYAICITSLMTLFDGSTMILLEPNCINQHNSYKVIDTVKEYINNRPLTEYSYELYIKVDILNNFIATLYRNITNLKGARRQLLLSRHLNSHGIRYLNNRVNALRLLNALYFSNIVIKELNLTEQFTKIKKNDKNFTIKNNNSSIQV